MDFALSSVADLDSGEVRDHAEVVPKQVLKVIEVALTGTLHRFDLFNECIVLNQRLVVSLHPEISYVMKTWVTYLEAAI